MEQDATLVLDSTIFDVFLKKSLLLTKPAFLWSKVQQKQYNFEIFLLFKGDLLCSFLQDVK